VRMHVAFMYMHVHACMRLEFKVLWLSEIFCWPLHSVGVAVSST
jgi:hypothetical protein